MIIAYMWNLEKIVQMNLFTKQKQSHRHREQTYGYQGEKELGGMSQEIGTDIYILLYMNQITNKNILYNTGNSAQYSVMSRVGKKIYMGKNIKKSGYMYNCFTLL